MCNFFSGIRERWYALPNWQRHAGGTAVIVMLMAGVQDFILGGISWIGACVLAWLLAFAKEMLDSDCGSDTATDLWWNTVGVIFVLLVIMVLGNNIVWQVVVR